ncbi:MAG: ABC transporter ATP-binding protein [Deltaproteobacteria bacterium]|nr:ABC transporter ATP-binding protein [Deltaproteobacteria bacterium]
MLEVERLAVQYGPITALRGVSFRVPAGRIAALLGANGAGKTTVMRAVTGLVTPQRGRILLDGEEIQGLPPHLIVRRGVGVCPEGRRLFPHLSVMDNLRLGAYTLADPRQQDPLLEQIFALFPRLAERRRQPAGTLSGGEQQMLALGRALMSRPRLLLLDEPSLGLAPLLVAEVFATIGKLNAQGVTILLVEQNAHAALAIAHHAYVLENGRLVLEGTGPEMLSHPYLKAAYLGNGQEG